MRRDNATLDLFARMPQDAPHPTGGLTPVRLPEGAPARSVASAGALPGSGPIITPEPGDDGAPPAARPAPTSPDTGGALNAGEALRVATRQSIEVMGRRFLDGRVTCAKHKDLVVFGGGSRWTLFVGPNAKLIGKCCACKKPVIGEEG